MPKSRRRQPRKGKRDSLAEMVAACSRWDKNLSDELNKSYREQAKAKLREYFRLKDAAEADAKAVIRAQKGLTTKRIQKAHNDWISTGRKIPYHQFLRQRQVDAARMGVLLCALPG